MAHQVETMAYAGEVPWHGLGKKVEHKLTPEEMLKAAGLDWTVSKRPVYYADKPNTWDLNDPRGEAKMLRAQDDYLIVRDSDNRVLSHCGEGFVPFQNHETMSFFKKFTDAGHMEMDTAGSLSDGERVWGLAKIKKGFKLAGGDDIEGYLLMANSHKVGTAMTMMFTPIRVVCNNTITLALESNGITGKFRVLHLQMFDEEIMQAAETALGISGEQMKTFQEQSEFLANKRATRDQVDNFIAELFQPKLLIERGKTKEADLPPLHEEFSKTSQMVLEAIETSPGHSKASAKGTWWGALNGVTYVMDHQKRAKSRDHALNSAWFGTGATTKRKAMTKALEFAKVS
jgi:phage/plasmid-like protein (TIGR03299 family)|tara:strand:- start:486 stop:1517 length:1032 start_codon:yes stop_codon:yes gene_type:complete